MDMVYRISYYAGVQTLRLLHRLGRFFTLLFLPFRLLFGRVVRVVRHRSDGRVREGFGGLRRRFSQAGDRVKEAWKRHPLLGVLQALHLPAEAAKHYKGFTRLVLTSTASLCALAILFGTMQYWGRTTYALALADDDGRVWGYVAQEEVLQDGVAMANERLGRLTATNALAVSPVISLQMIRQASIWDERQICDHLLSKAGVDTREACGVYIDGAFYGALSNRRTAQDMLENILEESRAGKPDVKSSFVERVELVEGLYPADQLVTLQAMKESLLADAVEEELYVFKPGDALTTVAVRHGISLAELIRLNPYAAEGVSAGQTLVIRRGEPHLRVLMTGKVQYEAEIPYTVQRVADASMYEGREKTRVKGRNGRSLITAEVTYLDGREQSSMITEQTVLEQPVTQVVAYGTKKKANKGCNLAWPVPSTRFITDYFSMTSGDRHRGIDISNHNIEGKDIVAADDGTVIVSRDPKGTSYWSYGMYIVIDHGGGYQTLYAHCSELLVKEGETVKKGQVIAKVGNTGRSTGPHLHYEVIVNGRNVNPLNYY